MAPGGQAEEAPGRSGAELLGAQRGIAAKYEGYGAQVPP